LARDLEAGASAPIPLAVRAPHPYDSALISIELRHGDGPLRLIVENETLVVAADRAALEVLSRNIAFFVGDASPQDGGAHLHVEWYPGNECIAQDSEPLVIAFDQP
jgi:hypothetical protein